MDPVAEQLHRHRQEQARNAPDRRERKSDTLWGAGLLVIAGALAIAFPPDGADLVVAAGFAVLFAALWQIEFAIGPGVATPVQLLVVPMWFSLPPSLFVPVVAVGQVLGNVIASARDRNEDPWGRVLIGVPDAWYAVGPALVMGLAAPASGIADLRIAAVALAAQFLVDAISSIGRTFTADGTRPRDQVGGLGWMWMVDASLAPLSFLVALAVMQQPWAIVAILPFAGLLAQFARERDAGVLKALELSDAYRGTARLMGDVLEADDAYTGGEHTHGVVELSLSIGRRMGLDARQLRTLEFGALLHDIGKLRVPNEIINKPGKLTDEEWAIIKRHPGYGQEMLDRVGGELSHVGTVVRAHHERWDGAGYPDGLAGDAIPVEARIITVCDSFSAMTTDRSYRKGMSIAQALGELERCAGEQFDPAVVVIARSLFSGTPASLPLRALDSAHRRTPGTTDREVARHAA